MITKEYLLERFEYSEGELYWRVVYSNRLKVGQLAGDKDGRGYRRVMLGKQHYKMHRVIWIMHFGDIPSNLVVDHIDRDISNNKIENLRLFTKSQNALNVGKIYKGVSYDRKRRKWRAQISINNKNKFLGRFESKELAEEAYQIASTNRDLEQS